MTYATDSVLKKRYSQFNWYEMSARMGLKCLVSDFREGGPWNLRYFAFEAPSSVSSSFESVCQLVLLVLEF